MKQAEKIVAIIYSVFFIYREAKIFLQIFILQLSGLKKYYQDPAYFKFIALTFAGNS